MTIDNTSLIIEQLFRNAAVDAYITSERPAAGSEKTMMVAFPEFERAVMFAYEAGRADGDKAARGDMARRFNELREWLGG